MYFKDREDTDINDEFNNDGFIFRIFNFFKKYKMFLIVALILLIVLIVVVLFSSRGNIVIDNTVNYLVLSGDDVITIYEDSDYIEPGYNAYNSRDEDLNKEVKISSNLDIENVGEYEITYILFDIVKTRKIIVVEKPKVYTFIRLNTIDNKIDLYLKLGQDYIEPGYQVFSSNGNNLNDKVEVSGFVDTSKKGVYKLTYSIVDSEGVTISTSRTITVIDTEINLSLNTTEYTNKDVLINVRVVDEFFDYMVLPDGSKVTYNNYSYKVSKNGKYIFKTYNSKGMQKESSIEVKNIDKVAPSGSCVIDHNNNGSFITISAKDESGIRKYEYNGMNYAKNVINLSTYIDGAKVIIYDNAGNKKEISCKSVALPTTINITNDGVIVNVKVKNSTSKIAGYYFSYTNKRPNKNSGGYLATSNESLDVVRLPGTTYVWVEDVNGKISNPSTIVLGNEILLQTKNGYDVLRGTKLSDFLSQKGWSIDEFNKLIARSVRAAGIYTKEGAATAAVALELVLIQKYKIKLPYWRGGKTISIGAYGSWGVYRVNPTYEGYNYYGMDCDGLVNWAYYNAGIEYTSITKNSYYLWSGIDYSKSNGEVGDVLRRSGHVAIIIGKNSNGFIVAEAYGEKLGIVINTYSYSDKSGYTIIKGERLFDNYQKFSLSNYPSGF